MTIIGIKPPKPFNMSMDYVKAVIQHGKDWKR
jgi:hypothetical protein